MAVYFLLFVALGTSPPSKPQRKDSPPLSSFGSGKKIPAALLPVQDKAELLNKLENLYKAPPPKQPLVKTNSSFLKQNGTTFKPQQTVNYTQVVVEKKNGSPPPQQGQSFGKTQYAEVVLPGSSTETDAGADVPSLPPKEGRHDDPAPIGNVWVKNRQVLPLLPPKKGRERVKSDLSPTVVEAPPNFKPPPVPVKMEHPKLKVETKAAEVESKDMGSPKVKDDSTKLDSPDSCEGPPTFKPPPVPVKMDQAKQTMEEAVKPATPVGTPEQARKMKDKGYEDMSLSQEPLSTPGTPTKETKSPQKSDQYTTESINLRNSPVNRPREVNYENVELKPKPKVVKELSMLITELDKKDDSDRTEEYTVVDRSSTTKFEYEDVRARKAHSYENIATPDSLSHVRHSTTPGTPPGEIRGSKEYENMEILEIFKSGQRLVNQQYEKMDDGFRKHDEQEEPGKILKVKITYPVM